MKTEDVFGPPGVGKSEPVADGMFGPPGELKSAAIARIFEREGIEVIRVRLTELTPAEKVLFETLAEIDRRAAAGEELE